MNEQLAQQYPFYPFPTIEEISELRGTIKLGTVNKVKGANIFFSVAPDSLTMHTMISGRTGTGKSWLLANLVQEMITPDMTFNVVLPDTKLFYRRLIGRVPGLNVITFDKFKFNPLGKPDWMNPQDFIFLFSKIFAADNLLGPPSAGLIREGLERLFKEKGIFEGNENYATLPELFAVIAKLQKHKIIGFRYRDFFEAVFNRLAPYVFLRENFCIKRGIQSEVFARENVVVELPLIKISDLMHNFFVSWIANLNYARAMVLGLRGNQLRTLFPVDEGRTILSAPRERSDLGWIEPGINEPITKGREFGIGFLFASQEMRSFSQVFRSNCLLKVCFPLTEGEDVSEVQKSFGLNEQQTKYLFELPNRRIAICRYGEFPRPFLLVVPELAGLEKVPNDQEVEQAMSGFYRRILPREDEEIIEIQEPIMPQFNYSPAEIDGVIMLRHLAGQPFLNYGELISELHLTPTRGDEARAWIANSGFLIDIHSITLRRGKPGEYFELTEHAYKKFRGNPPSGKGGFVHKCFCHAIKEFWEEQGFGARLEGILERKKGPFDVLAWKEGEGMFGYEVTLHFQNLLQNLVEDLRTTVKKVVVVCRNKDDLERAKTIARNGLANLSRVEFKTIFEFTSKKSE